LRRKKLRMTLRRSLQSRITAARTVRDIMSRCDLLDCDQPKLRALCALLYSVASEEPKACYKHKMFEVMKYEQSEIDEDKTAPSIVVDCITDLVIMSLGVLIEKVSDDAPASELGAIERANLLASIRVKKELIEVERMILSEEEMKIRLSEEKKREEQLRSSGGYEKERKRKARYRQKMKGGATTSEEEKIDEEDGDEEWNGREEDGNGEWNGIKSEPIDDEYPQMNPNEKILNLCESLPSTSGMNRVKEELVDEEEVKEIEPSNFMTRTRARMKRLGRLTSGGTERREKIVGATVEISGVKRMNSNVFEPSNSKDNSLVNKIPRVNLAMNPTRPGPSLLKSRLGRLQNDDNSPPSSSTPPLTLRSILQSEMTASQSDEKSSFQRKRIKRGE
ncbi:hypothetical protein PMAYCL1PPCAC_06989, partial [Pristionchus mayeri]